MALCVASEKLIFIVISIIAVIFLLSVDDVRSQKLKQISLLWCWMLVSQTTTKNKTRTNAKKGKERARKIQLVRASE